MTKRRFSTERDPDYCDYECLAPSPAKFSKTEINAGKVMVRNIFVFNLVNESN